jgi:secretion/DNA translocation related TadE-like protein
VAVPVGGAASRRRHHAPGVRVRSASLPETERGSVSVVAAAVPLMVAVLVLAAADLWRVMGAAAHAQTAADAAALAAAQEQVAPAGSDPARAAASYARANGATLVSCSCPPDGSRVSVTVAVTTGPLAIMGGSRTVTRRAGATSTPGGGP